MNKCTKKSFNSYKKAENHALQIELINNDLNHPKLKAYKCNLCGKFHLTSNRKNKIIIDDINLKNEREFILSESRHWEQKFGIDY